MSDIWNSVKKQGFKINLFKIPTRKTPVQIEHSIREEFDRARVLNTLNRSKDYLAPLHDPVAQQLTVEITVLIRELESYKK